MRRPAEQHAAADGGTAVLSSVVAQALLSGGAAPAAERGALGRAVTALPGKSLESP